MRQAALDADPSGNLRHHCSSMTDLVAFDGPPFDVHRTSGAVPVMAGRTRCTEKFFTPSTLLKDALGAGEYLRAKFDSHGGRLPKRPRWLP